MSALIYNELVKIYFSKLKWLFVASIGSIFVLSILFGLLINYEPTNYMMYALDIGLFRIIITTFVIIIAVLIFADEYQEETIKLLLIRPVSRTKLFFAKVFTVFILGILMVLIVYGLSLAVGFVYTTEQPTSMLIQQKILVNYSSEIARFMTMGCFAMMLAIFFQGTVFALTISFVVTYGMMLLTTVLSLAEAQWARFLLFPNLDFSQYFFDNMPQFLHMNLAFSIVMIVIHIIGFLTVGWYFFVKRDVYV